MNQEHPDVQAGFQRGEEPEIKLPTFTSAAAATAKSLQSCPTLYNPIDGSPPGSPVPGILQARTLEWAAISFSNAWKWKVKVKSLSKGIPEKNNLFLFHWLHKILWLDHNKLWKTLQGKGVPDLSPKKRVCWSRRNRTRHGTTDWFKLGKGVYQAYTLSPSCLTYMQST